MKVARKLVVTGGASLVLAGGILALPISPVAGASQVNLEAMKKPLDSYVIKKQTNASFDVKTEVNATSHSLQTTVTNKTDTALHPTITFNGKPPLYDTTAPLLEPGEQRSYLYSFTGNNFGVEVKVMADGAETATSLATIAIQEPMSFQAKESNDTVVIGTLRNNSTLVPQTVYTKSFNDAVKIEHLEPGESRTIAIPHTAYEGQTTVGLTIANAGGYESNYAVELGLTPELPMPLDT